MGRRTEKRLRLLLAAAGSVMILLTQTPPQTVRSNLSLWAREITGWFGDAQTPAWLAHPLTDDAVFWFGVTLVMVAAGWTATSYIRRGTGTDARGALAPSQQPNDAKAETGTRFDLYVHLRPNAANILNRDNLRKQDDDPPGVHTPHIVREDDTPESGKTRSHLSPEFYSCSILGKDVTVEPIDATLCGIGSLFQRLERRPDFFPQLENNTYINLSFVRDDGYRFEIMLKNAPEPGIIGDRFAILWVSIGGKFAFDYGIYNHATGRWVIVLTVFDLHHDIWRRVPSSAKHIAVGLIATMTIAAGSAVWFFAPPPLSWAAGLAALLTAAVGIAIQRVNTRRLWFFLRKALAAIEIS